MKEKAKERFKTCHKNKKTKLNSIKKKKNQELVQYKKEALKNK